MTAARHYYGKYRGKVEQNQDPLQQGRVMVSVPAVTGSGRMNWAMPCAPFAGAQVGFFAIPPVGANVWVEYEAGNPDRPIWSGAFWGVGEVPAVPALPQVVVLKTATCTLTLSDIPGAGGIKLEMGTMKIAIGAMGIEINGAPSMVTVTGSQIKLG